MIGRRLLLPLLGAVLLFGLAGCSEKNYFEPEKIEGSIRYDGELPAKIVETGYDGATLQNGQVITKEEGLLSWKLPEGYRYITHSGSRVLAAGDCLPNIVYDTETHRRQTIDLPRRIVAGLFIPGTDNIAFVIEGNRYGLYDLEQNRTVAIYDSDKALTADIRIANPMMLDQLVLIPTLDGKLAILNKQNGAKIREIVVGEGEDFNNVIFLQVIGNRLVAATPHRIISVSPKIMDAQSMEISDVIFVSDAIYILAKDGNVYHCDTDLKILNRKKFPFAHFVGAIYGEFIYLVEREGYIIATDPVLSVANVFKFPDRIETWFFTTPTTIYYDRYYFRLNTEHPRVSAPETETAGETTENSPTAENNASSFGKEKRSEEKSFGVEEIWHSIKSLFEPDESADTAPADR